jgi:hypothetical protein
MERALNDMRNLPNVITEFLSLYADAIPLYLKLKEYLLFVILTVNVLMKPFLNKSFNAILKSLFYDFYIDLILNSGMIGTTGVALDFIYQGIAKNRISLAPLSATQALLQDGPVC